MDDRSQVVHYRGPVLENTQPDEGFARPILFIQDESYETNKANDEWHEGPPGFPCIRYSSLDLYQHDLAARVAGVRTHVIGIRKLVVEPTNKTEPTQSTRSN